MASRNEEGEGGWDGWLGANDARIKKGRSTQAPRRLYSYEAMAIDYGFVMAGVVPLPKHRATHISLTPCKAQPVRTEMLSVGFAFFLLFFLFFFKSSTRRYN